MSFSCSDLLSRQELTPVTKLSPQPRTYVTVSDPFPPTPPPVPLTLSPLVKSESKSAALFTGTDEERLKACLAALHDTERTKRPTVGSPDSAFAKNLQRVLQYLETVVKPTTTLKKPRALYVSGVPGTGKTCGVMWCCKLAASLRETPTFSPTVGIINAGHIASVKDPTECLVHDISAMLCLKNRQESCIKSTLTRRVSPARYLILVMDEIDSLVVSSRHCAALDMLMKWTSDPNMRFCMICISNILNNRSREKVFSGVEVRVDYISLKCSLIRWNFTPTV